MGVSAPDTVAELAYCNAHEKAGTEKSVVGSVVRRLPGVLAKSKQRSDWFWVQVPAGVKTEKPLLI